LKVIENEVREAIEKKLLVRQSIDHALVHGHFLKAYHDLSVMDQLNRLNASPPPGWVGCPDWVVVSGYFGMYHSAKALLALKGWDSKDHDATIRMLAYLYVFQEGKLTLAEVRKLEKARTLHEEVGKLAEAKRARKTASYGVDFSGIDTEFILENARPFVERMRLVMKEVLGYDLLSR